MGWDNVGEGGGGDYFKIDAGEKAMLHVLAAEPHSVWQYYNQSIKKGCVVPDGFKMPGGEKLRRQHALPVYSYKDAGVKLWMMSNTVAQMVKEIYDTYEGDLSGVDLKVGRTGSGLETVYSVIPLATKWNEELQAGVILPEIEKLLEPADEATIMKIIGGQDPDTDFDPEKLEKMRGPDKSAERAAAPAASGNGANEKLKAIKFFTNLFATKLKDPKKRTELLKKASGGKKTLLSQFDLEELRKLGTLVK